MSQVEEEATQEILAAVRALLTEIVQLRKNAEMHFQTVKEQLDAMDARLVDALSKQPRLN
jgi:hypothetical protein